MSQPPSKTIKCRVCRKEISIEQAPFCSKTCRDRDLIAWIDEDYKVPRPIIDENDEFNA